MAARPTSAWRPSPPRRRAGPALFLALLAVPLGACRQSPPQFEPGASVPPPAPPGRAAAAAPVGTPAPEDAQALLLEAQAALRSGNEQGALQLCDRVRGSAVPARVQAGALVCIATVRFTPGAKLADAQAGSRALAALEQLVREQDVAEQFAPAMEILRRLQSSESGARALREQNRKFEADLAARDKLIRDLRALSVERD